MVSLRCLTLALPVLACLVPLLISTAIDGRVWDAMPTWRPADMPDLTGKVAIVTGPTLNGIGYETALELARRGAHVILAGRSRSKGQEALQALIKELPRARAEFAELDLSSLASVRDFTTKFLSRRMPLHILVNNAGVMMNPFGLTVDGYESQFATNHLGHYLLTRLLLPKLESSAPSRVVTVSSLAAWFPDIMGILSMFLPASMLPSGVGTPLDYNTYLGADTESIYNSKVAYGRSKLANVLFSRALARRVASKKVHANSCHPGGIRTNLQRHVKEDTKRSMGDTVASYIFTFVEPLMLTPKQGAVTQLYLATAPEVESQGIHGRHYRPQAITATPPWSVSVSMEEHLWNVSESLVKGYL